MGYSPDSISGGEIYRQL